MKNTLALICAIVGLSSMQAQDKDWSVELNYPVSIGENFGASNQGLLGLGLKYRFATSGKWRFGSSLDGIWFSTEFVNDSDPPQIAKVRDLFIQPRFFAALPVTQNRKLQFLVGLGWAIYRISEENFIGERSTGKTVNWNSGLNANTGLTFDISNSWFLATQFDLILSSGETADRTIGLMKIGAGYRF